MAKQPLFKASKISNMLKNTRFFKDIVCWKFHVSRSSPVIYLLEPNWNNVSTVPRQFIFSPLSLFKVLQMSPYPFYGCQKCRMFILPKIRFNKTFSTSRSTDSFPLFRESEMSECSIYPNNIFLIWT